MDIETLLREALADQAFDAPQADDDFIPRALAARSARRRRTAATGGAVAAVAIVVAAVSTTAAVGGRDGVASPSSATQINPGAAELNPVLPAPPPAQQQADLATYLRIADPPAVPVIRLVTPGQAERLVNNCLVEAGWGHSTGNTRTSVDVATGEIASSSYGGGFSYTTDQQPAFDLASYICMASYPIDPAYTEDSEDPYVRSSLIEAAGPGQQPPGYRFNAIAALVDSSSSARVVPSVAWVNDGDFLAVTTVGSSSCPTGPVTWTAGNNELTITTGELHLDADDCTADSSQYTTILEIPTGIDPTVDLAITVDGVEATLPGLL